MLMSTATTVSRDRVGRGGGGADHINTFGTRRQRHFLFRFGGVCVGSSCCADGAGCGSGTALSMDGPNVSSVRA
jgi:hypothetical protein